jgi:hypothetical protein
MGESCSTLKKKKSNEVTYKCSKEDPADLPATSQSFIDSLVSTPQLKQKKPSWRKKNLSLDIAIIENDASSTLTNSQYIEEFFQSPKESESLNSQHISDSDQDNSLIMEELSVPDVKHAMIDQDSFYNRTLDRNASLYARNSLIHENVSYEDSEDSILYRSREFSIGATSIPPSKIVFTLSSEEESEDRDYGFKFEN